MRISDWSSDVCSSDLVIVPAMSRDDDSAVLAWLRRQSDKGAIVIAICAGAKVVGAAGLLGGKRATTHWYYLKDLLRRSPTLDYVAARRLFIDARVAPNLSLTAPEPMLLPLTTPNPDTAKTEESRT